MKAIQVATFGGPEVLQLKDIPEPKPGADDVLVRVHAAGVNPADTYMHSGTYAVKPPLPYTPGMDGAGVVESVGTKVTSVKAGDRVYIAGSLSGTYAEKVLCKPSQVHRLPDSITFEQGAAMGVPYGTAYYALFLRAQALSGETVLIHGASGGVGTAAVQLAISHKLVVIGTGGTPKGRDLVKQEGATYVLDHHDPQYLDQLMKITSDKGVNLIIEMLANVNLGKDLKVLAKGGRVVVVGSRGKVEIDPRDTMGRNASILGMTIMNATDEERKNIHADLVKGLENGSLKPVIGKTLPLADAAQAHVAVMQPGAHGKIVLTP